MTPAPRGALRRPPAGPPKRALLIFTEGERTEVQYIDAWHRLSREHVAITISSEHGDPRHLVDSAVRAKAQDARESRRGGGAPFDEIWCVFDVDQHHHRVAAIEKAWANGIYVAQSNPCIELWFALHFQDQRAHLDRHAAQALAKQHTGCDKVLSPGAIASLVENYRIAADRSIALAGMHEGNGSAPDANPSSNLWQAVESFRKA